jgi:hypothetical protein
MVGWWCCAEVLAASSGVGRGREVAVAVSTSCFAQRQGGCNCRRYMRWSSGGYDALQRNSHARRRTDDSSASTNASSSMGKMLRPNM